MLKYKHILLATDLSEESEKVATKASNLATRSNAKLSVVHVLEHTPVVFGGGEFSIPLDMSLEEQLTQNIQKALAMLSSRFHIHEENQYIAHGSVKKEIIELADKLKIDLIVVGSHGHSGIEVLLGSVANAILHTAKCDILAVRIKS